MREWSQDDFASYIAAYNHCNQGKTYYQSFLSVLEGHERMAAQLQAQNEQQAALAQHRSDAAASARLLRQQQQAALAQTPPDAQGTVRREQALAAERQRDFERDQALRQQQATEEKRRYDDERARQAQASLDRSAAESARNAARIDAAQTRRQQEETKLMAEVAKINEAYLPKCQNPELIKQVTELIQGQQDRGGRPYHVLKIYDVKVYATTPRGIYVINLARNEMSPMETVGAKMGGSGVTLPICLASVITDHASGVWGYGWEAVDGQNFLHVQPWNHE